MGRVQPSLGLAELRLGRRVTTGEGCRAEAALAAQADATMSVRHERVTGCAIVERVGQCRWVGPVPVEASAIDEEGRCSGDAAPVPRMEVAANAIAPGVRREVVRNRNWIHAGCGRVLDQIVVLQRILVLVQQIVHGPERVLAAVDGNRLGCLGRGGRMRVGLGYWKVSVDESYAVTHLFQNLLKDPVGLTAPWTLVIAVLDERNRRI